MGPWPGCGTDTPTSLLLSVQNGPEAPLPDQVRMRVFDSHGLAYDVMTLPVPAAAANAKELGTVLVYPKRPDDPLIKIQAVGFKAGNPVSEKTAQFKLPPGKQSLADLVLAAGKAADSDGDGVPDNIDNCPTLANVGQENADGDNKGDACGGSGATDGGPAGGDGPLVLVTEGGDALGVAGSKVSGSTCRADSECRTGFCADGVCCDGACKDTCVACNVAGQVGTCALVPSGQDLRNDCKEDKPETCALDGTCNGAGACRKYAPGTICRAPACQAGATSKVVQAGTCDGGGGCTAGQVRDCAPYTCSAGVCRTVCANSGECEGNKPCAANSCGLKPLGATCALRDECQSGNCVDGVCCDAADCAGPCRACNVTGSPGTCKPKLQGDDPKVAGGCVVEASTTCGRSGKCDGLGDCQKYPAGTTCGTRRCVGAAEMASTCNGTGTCLPLPPRGCGSYLCRGDACANSCASDSECATTAYCQGGLCRARRPNGQSCTETRECTSANCVSSTCCAVACLPTQECPGGLACRDKVANGMACARPGDCLSGFCADGFCCDTACTETCKSCGQPFMMGRCAFVPPRQTDSIAATPCRPPRACDGAGLCI